MAVAKIKAHWRSLAASGIGLAFYGAIAVAFEQLGKDAPFNQIEQCAAQACVRMEAALRSVAVEGEQNPAKINWKC